MADYLDGSAERFRISAEDSVLLVVDMQYASASRTAGLGRVLAEQGRTEEGAYRFDEIEQRVTPAIVRLLSGYRGAGARVAYAAMASDHTDLHDMPPYLRPFARLTGNLPGSREQEILDELAPGPTELVFRKTTSSAFASTTLRERLQEWRVRSLVLAGVSTSTCVESTARDAADYGFDVVLVADACTAARPELHEAALDNFSRLMGRVMSTGAVLEDLARAS
jgi:nicotinamidase-related amidase